MLASAAAQAIGFAVKLDEWKKVLARSSERCASKISGVQSVAASGSEPPVSPLARQRMSGVMPACSQAKSVPVRPQPGHHLVGDEERRRGRLANAPHLGEHGGRVGQHAAGAEDQRLDDERRRPARVRQAASSASSVACSRACGGKRNAHDVEQQRLVGGVEDAARAGRHGADGVAVIAVLERDDARARLAAVAPVAERHLERDLDRGRAAVGKEDVREPWGAIATSFSARRSAGSWVKPAKIT